MRNFTQRLKIFPETKERGMPKIKRQWCINCTKEMMGGLKETRDMKRQGRKKEKTDRNEVIIADDSEGLP